MEKKPENFERIYNTEDYRYKSFKKIYTGSFPIYEQRNEEQQQKAFESKQYRLAVLTEKDDLISFISYWEFDDYIYIEHLAVNPTMRGKNIGSMSLDLFAKKSGKTIILEIDPPVDNISQNRLRFYERLGYKLNSFIHFHPAYNPVYPPHELKVLSLKNELSDKEYKQFQNDLENIVMK